MANQYHEPWVVRKKKPTVPRPPAPDPDDWSPDADIARSIREGWERAESKMSYYIWGSRVHEPLTVTNPGGKRIEMDDKGILAEFPHHEYLEERGITHQSLANRAAECVNAFAGIHDPTSFMLKAKELIESVAVHADLCYDDAVELLTEFMSAKEVACRIQDRWSGDK